MSQDDPIVPGNQTLEEMLPRVAPSDLRDAWPVLDAEARVEGLSLPELRREGK